MLSLSKFSVRGWLHILTGAIVVPMAILLTYTVYNNYRQEEQAATTASYNLARLTVDNVQAFLDDARVVLDTLARRAQMQHPGCDPIFKDFKDIYPQLSNLSRSSPDGYLVCSARDEGDNRLTFVGDMAWFKQVYERREFVVGPIVFGPISKGYVAVLAHPLFDADGTMIGALQTPIDLLKFRLVPATNKLPAATVITIIDKEGTIIARSQNPEKFIGKNVRNVRMIGSILRLRNGTIKATSVEGIERLYGFLPVPGTDWMVLAGTDTEVALANARYAAIESSLVGGAIVLLVLLLAIYFARRIAGPILAIRETAKTIASGDMTPRAPLGGPLEIAEVATQFNHMLDAISASRIELLESENRLKLAMQGARLALWDYDFVADRIYFAETWSELLGGPSVPTDYALDAFVAEVPPEDLLALQAALRAIFRKQTGSFKVEHRFRNLCGELVWFDSQGSPTQHDAKGRVTRMVGICRDITERKAAQTQIQRLAFYDPLTELPNRRMLMERLTASATVRDVESLSALLFIDLDNFKEINDSLGHAQGDLVLQEVGRRLRASIRKDDLAARLGGDEFVIMLTGLGADPETANVLAKAAGDKICKVLDQTFELGGELCTITSSIGITLFGGDLADPVGEPLKRADMAMFQAKAAGRNTIRMFEPEMQERLLRRIDLVNELRHAVQKKQFLLHYQPQITADGEIIGVEALVRWLHPTRGMVPPFEFIALAEECGLILQLGNWVLETACRQLVDWAATPELAQLSIAVNVSAIELYQTRFADDVLMVVAQTGANPRKLKLELTEGVLLKNVEETIAKMTTLQAHGIEFSLDDFGTGYSSLSYLKRLPLNQLKIDQSFVRDILEDPNDASIAIMVITLAKSLGLTVIAEGVETDAQRAFLAAHGCLAYQGYYFSRPLPIGDLEAYCRAGQARRLESSTP